VVKKSELIVPVFDVFFLEGKLASAVLDPLFLEAVI